MHVDAWEQASERMCCAVNAMCVVIKPRSCRFLIRAGLSVIGQSDLIHVVALCPDWQVCRKLERGNDVCKKASGNAFDS